MEKEDERFVEEVKRLSPLAFRGTGSGELIEMVKRLKVELEECLQENGELRERLAKYEKPSPS